MIRITLQRTSHKRDIERVVQDERKRILESVRESQARSNLSDMGSAYRDLIETLDEVLAP